MPKYNGPKNRGTQNRANKDRENKERLYRLVDFSYGAVHAFIEYEDKVSDAKAFEVRMNMDRILTKTFEDLVGELKKLTE